MLQKAGVPAVLICWLLLVNIVSCFLWKFGPAIFSLIMLNLSMLYYVQRQPTQFKSMLFVSTDALVTFTVIVFIPSTIFCFWLKQDWIVDIAANTYAAVEHFISGDNPYNHRSQLWVESFPQRHGITFMDGQYFMFGVPYQFGYPYFPAMLLAYTPVIGFIENYTAIRIMNFTLSFVNLWLVWQLLKAHFEHQKHYQLAKRLAFVLLFLMPSYLFNLYYLGITDVLLTTLILLSLFFVDKQRIILAAIVLGMCQASKLLPAPFVFVAIFLWLPILRQKIQFALVYGITALVILGPFVLWDATSFLSSTILYYLTHHKGGDDTSLWFYLPEFIKPYFLILSPLLSGVFLLFGSLKAKGSTINLALVCASSYFIFMVFNKMTHFNYYWSVYPIACIPLCYQLVLLMVQKERESKGLVDS